jgi:hypothetical protein
MKTINVNENSLNRLAKAIMEKHSIGYTDALSLLGKFRLNLVCDKSLIQSAALQASLLTAVNTGKRAFHGGVFVSMPCGIPCRLNWPGKQTLNEVVQSLGGRSEAIENSAYSHTLYFGTPADGVEDGLRVICSGWRGGIAPAGGTFDFSPTSDFAIGGILAGSFGVAKGFLRVAGLSFRHVEKPQGISLWRPDLDWTAPESEGPDLEILPKNLWLLGLGHLGQAYLWNLALLPFAEPERVGFLLQDFDRIVEGNFSSGLLCEEETIGKCKTRVCSDWLEARGFRTIITERAFDSNTRRTGDEPFVALCGFDDGVPRRLLESAGFELVVECALGADAEHFDRIILHTFPDASKKAQDIWVAPPPQQLNQAIVDAFKTVGDCGILAETLTRKAIATSFVGAFAGALAIGELLRALHGGVRCEYIRAHLRENDMPRMALMNENYLNRVARSGYCFARKKVLIGEVIKTACRDA